MYSAASDPRKRAACSLGAMWRPMYRVGIPPSGSCAIWGVCDPTSDDARFGLVMFGRSGEASTGGRRFEPSRPGRRRDQPRGALAAARATLRFKCLGRHVLCAVDGDARMPRGHQKSAGAGSATNNRSSPWSTPRAAAFGVGDGVSFMGFCSSTPPSEDLDRVTNLRAWLCTAAAPRMIERGGARQPVIAMGCSGGRHRAWWHAGRPASPPPHQCRRTALVGQLPNIARRSHSSITPQTAMATR